MRMLPRREAARAGVLAAVALVATTLVLVDPVRGAGDAALNAAASVWRAAFGARTEPATERRVIVVLTAPSLADRVAAASTLPSPAHQRKWSSAAVRAQQKFLLALRDRGVEVHPDNSFSRTFNGFSAALDARAVAEVERAPDVAGVYPVRTTYPASVSATTLEGADFGATGGRRPGAALPGFDGAGITIALLDTGVTRRHPYLHGRVLPGIDVVDGKGPASAAAKPDDATALEAHGTRLAGILVGSGGPGGLHGVAPGARVLPIRVAGWRQTRDGSYAVIGRGDELLAGLERAVDPDGNGDVTDAARVALSGVSEPFAAFADSPEARAADGAARLGTLLVAPAGNDGSGGPGFGTVGGPAGSPAALAVGALDARARLARARVAFAVGANVRPSLTDGERVSVLGAVGPSAAVSLPAAGLFGPSLAHADRPSSGQANGDELADFFGPDGGSRVAGRAVVLSGDGRDLARRVRNAAAAGAAAVLVADAELPSGGLELGEGVELPVLGIEGSAGREALTALSRGEPVTVAIAPAASVRNAQAGSVVAFSSSGLAFDGRVKPDLLAPGVEIATADAGRSSSDRYATVTGTSAAAAVVAGSAALVAQARPGLGAPELHGLLVGGAAEGGRLDPGSAAAGELVAVPATLALGRASGPDWKAGRTLVVENVSTRGLDVGLASVTDEGGDAVSFAADPARFHLAPGARAQVVLVATTSAVRDGPARGAIVLQAAGARPVRIPWSVSFRQGGAEPLLGDVRLSTNVFTPADAAPAVLAFRAGLVSATAEATSVEPVGLLDVELWNAKGKRLGLLARLRDVLPGRYAFGLTGRGPDGTELAVGEYELRLRAFSVDDQGGGKASVATARFSIVR